MKKLFKALAPAIISLLSVASARAQFGVFDRALAGKLAVGAAADASVVSVPVASGCAVFAGVAFELLSQPGADSLRLALNDLSKQYGFVPDLSFPPALVASDRPFSIQTASATGATETYLAIGYAPQGSLEVFGRDKAVRKVMGGSALSNQDLPALLTILALHSAKLQAIPGMQMLGIARSCAAGAPPPCKPNVLVHSDGSQKPDWLRAAILKEAPELAPWALRLEVKS